MPSAVEAVDLYLQRDPTLADTVSRGLANLRRTARWLIEENGWDATEDAVVSALRRYSERNPHQALAEPRRWLPEARIEVRGALALLTLPRTHDIQEDALRAWGAADVRDTLAILPSRTTVKVLIEEASIHGFCREFRIGRVEETVSPVSLVQVKLAKASAPIGVLTLILAALAHHQVEVLEVLSCAPACSVIVHEEDGRAAFDVLTELTS